LHLHLSELSVSERLSYWYTKREINMIRSDIKLMAKSCRNIAVSKPTSRHNFTRHYYSCDTDEHDLSQSDPESPTRFLQRQSSLQIPYHEGPIGSIPTLSHSMRRASLETFLKKQGLPIRLDQPFSSIPPTRKLQRQSSLLISNEGSPIDENANQVNATWREEKFASLHDPAETSRVDMDDSQAYRDTLLIGDDSSRRLRRSSSRLKTSKPRRAHLSNSRSDWHLTLHGSHQAHPLRRVSSDASLCSSHIPEETTESASLCRIERNSCDSPWNDIPKYQNLPGDWYHEQSRSRHKSEGGCHYTANTLSRRAASDNFLAKSKDFHVGGRACSSGRSDAGRSLRKPRSALRLSPSSSCGSFVRGAEQYAHEKNQNAVFPQVIPSPQDHSKVDCHLRLSESLHGQHRNRCSPGNKNVEKYWRTTLRSLKRTASFVHEAMSCLHQKDLESLIQNPYRYSLDYEYLTRTSVRGCENFFTLNLFGGDTRNTLCSRSIAKKAVQDVLSRFREKRLKPDQIAHEYCMDSQFSVLHARLLAFADELYVANSGNPKGIDEDSSRPTESPTDTTASSSIDSVSAEDTCSPQIQNAFNFDFVFEACSDLLGDLQNSPSAMLFLHPRESIASSRRLSSCPDLRTLRRTSGDQRFTSPCLKPPSSSRGLVMTPGSPGGKVTRSLGESAIACLKLYERENM
jgi:hypothetical protein